MKQDSFAQDDATTTRVVALSERAILIQALREIEALAASHTEPGYTLIYSKACAALNYAEVAE